MPLATAFISSLAVRRASRREPASRCAAFSASLSARTRLRALSSSARIASAAAMSSSAVRTARVGRRKEAVKHIQSSGARGGCDTAKHEGSGAPRTSSAGAASAAGAKRPAGPVPEREPGRVPLCVFERRLPPMAGLRLPLSSASAAPRRVKFTCCSARARLRWLACRPSSDCAGAQGRGREERGEEREGRESGAVRRMSGG